jgi:polysaccharide chain length determinant protein (PEP-CTERM system associated)
MLPGKVYSPASILALLWRRKWLLVLPTVLGFGLAVAMSSRLPNAYQSETQILVVPQRVPETFIKSTVTMRIEDRLRSIGPQILSRTRLEQIINELNLYPEQRANRALDDIVSTMRANINITIVRGDSFRITYTYSEPTATMKVTDRLAKDFILDNTRDRQAQAEGTSQFLEAQLGDARQRLIEQEQRLEDYRRRHAGELPTQLQSNLQIIQNTQMQLQSLNDALNRHRDRRLVVERMLSDLAIVEATVPPVVAADPAAVSQLPVEGQLTVARQRVNELATRGLTSQHPDYRAAERKVRELEATLAQERARMAPTPAAPRAAGDAGRRNQIIQLTAERDNLDRQIAAAAADEARLRQTMAQYQARIEAVPSRESELTELTRDYDTLQLSYRTLLGKKEESQIATNLENRQIGEQFRILDPARVPEKPISPNRPVINAGGGIAGLLLGLALIGLLEVRNGSLKSEADVLQVLNLPVLATVQLMGTETAPRGRLRRLLFGAGLVGLVVAGAGLAAWKGGF